MYLDYSGSRKGTRVPGVELRGEVAGSEVEEVTWVEAEDNPGLESIVTTLAFTLSENRAITEF